MDRPIKFGSVCSGRGRPAIDLTGQRFGRLLVIASAGRADDGHIAWSCLCDCGKTKKISSNSLTRKSPVQSCGCMNKTTAQVKKAKGGSWNDGKSYAIRDGEHCYKTRHAWAKAAIRAFGNACQICGWNKARCDVHHRDPKAQGGLHILANAIVLCPNCHRVEHDKGRGD